MLKVETGEWKKEQPKPWHIMTCLALSGNGWFVLKEVAPETKFSLAIAIAWIKKN